MSWISDYYAREQAAPRLRLLDAARDRRGKATRALVSRAAKVAFRAARRAGRPIGWAEARRRGQQWQGTCMRGIA